MAGTKTTRKRLKNYEKLAGTYGDPMEYLFKRMHGLKAAGKPEKAQALAQYLAPFGHAKAVPRDDDGEIMRDQLIIVRNGD